jgi:hypothetical protein
MAREPDASSLHRQVMTAVVRGARAQEESQAAIEMHASVDEQVRRTLLLVRQGRRRRAQALRPSRHS